MNSAVHKIVTKARQLVDVKKDDGFAALHLAALNGHLRTAETLINVVCNSFLLCFHHWQTTCGCSYDRPLFVGFLQVIPHPLKSFGFLVCGFLISQVPFSMCKQKCQCVCSVVRCTYLLPFVFWEMEVILCPWKAFGFMVWNFSISGVPFSIFKRWRQYITSAASCAYSTSAT